jgi:hypothetical protein
MSTNANIEMMIPPRDGKVEAVTVGVAATAAALITTAKVKGPSATDTGPGYYIFEAI